MIPKIIFEDSSIFVLDKPSGTTVNKADTTRHEITVQDWVEKEFRIQNLEFKIDEKLVKESEYEDPNITFKKRAGIVHRLDKETSGILLVAKNVSAFVNLQQQFKERVVKKKYLALAHGKLEEEGEIRVPVGRLQWNRKRFGVVAGGRESVTKYKRIMNLEFRIKNNVQQLTLLELYPETGRTHQIRVHLKYLNHPIFSDELYAGRKTAREDRKYLDRLFLHASSISFKHPTTDETITFSSQLPSDLQTFLTDYCAKI